MTMLKVIACIVTVLLFTNNYVYTAAGYSESLRQYNVTGFNRSNIGNFTYKLTNISREGLHTNETSSPPNTDVDCFGLGSILAAGVQWFLVGSCPACQQLDVKFYLTSRNQRRRVQVLIGHQFGLQWTDFKHQRRTVFIVHGFLSHSNETWIKAMEEAFLIWGDVNVVIVDWSAGGNSWNYYKAVINTRLVAHQITRLLSHIINATMADHPETNDWGPLHLVGHSLGAHICGLVAHNYKKIHNNNWIIERITGLDPAQPCFTTNDTTMKLDRTDAHYVDIIHTNGRLLSRLGLGLPKPIGHADFYPNGGMKQPGCFIVNPSAFNFIPISLPKISETICSHGRSYLYLTESLIAAANGNCSFWAHHWDLTYRNALQIQNQSCNPEKCAEMGIKAENYPHRGTFYVIVKDHPPFCASNQSLTQSELAYLAEDLADELDD